jgi:hypothetical protein
MYTGIGGDASEEDPVWLKAKGDDFYRGGDFRSALNAYSAAIDMNENMTACYSNRYGLNSVLFPSLIFPCKICHD